ncbi:hypothetical protein AB0C87_25175 [Actinomadura sp. NPDC048021]|uniref:hypothetical protein n=1 Tax=Actinomadura sp. NPDC048021 TaxID=3155385 RepID=UPI0033CAB360
MKMEFDGDLTLEDMADLFEAMGWEYAVPGCYGVPDEIELQKQIFRMYRTMEEDDLDYLHNGRIALVRDGEVGNAFQVLITAGYLYVGEEVEIL